MHDFPNFGYPGPLKGPIPPLPLQFHSNRKSAVSTLKRRLSLLQTTICPKAPPPHSAHFILSPKRPVCRSGRHLSMRTTFEYTLCGICADRAISSICRPLRTDIDKWRTTCFHPKSLPNFARWIYSEAKLRRILQALHSSLLVLPLLPRKLQLDLGHNLDFKLLPKLVRKPFWPFRGVLFLPKVNHARLRIRKHMKDVRYLPWSSSQN